MPIVTLPDGSQRTFDHAISIMDLATDIAPSLAKATLAGVINGQLSDADALIEQDAEVRIITAKDPEGLDIIRHSTAHLLAQAVKQLYPSVQVTIGPVIEDGFYYDFSFSQPFTEADLAAIEKRMAELVKQALPVMRTTQSRDEAVQYFSAQGEHYKAEIIRDIPAYEVLSLYTQGDFTDLCRGPHVPNTRHLKAFKLLRISGAYWRGDANNEMLQRIYGTAWANKEDLKAYLYRLEEAEKRDHRKLGKQQGLFHFQETSPGIAFWHPKGVEIWRAVEDYMRACNRRYGCTEIRTPLIAAVSLWEKSGHKAKYADNMFMTESENREYAIRPMNCPTCVQVYNSNLHSYRDLPVRMAEFGIVHRNEPSGSLHGLMRVRSFTQDDGHIFCREDQIQSEVCLMIEQAFEVYRTFGFEDFDIKLALRPAERIGSDEIWDKAEKALADALSAQGLTYVELPGEGAFYGPKIEFHLKDAIGRSWQCGTIQVDFSMPERLGATYVDEHSNKQVPVMLHRAIVGSLERFIGMVIEHFAGWLPTWLSPVHAVVMNITDRHTAYVEEVVKTLRQAGLRVDPDLRNEKIGFKIREHTISRAPYQLIIGDQEVENNQVSVRTRRGKDLGSMSISAFETLLRTEIDTRMLEQLEEPKN